jgi:hypothetical protein
MDTENLNNTTNDCALLDIKNVPKYENHNSAEWEVKLKAVLTDKLLFGYCDGSLNKQKSARTINPNYNSVIGPKYATGLAIHAAKRG